MQLLVEYSRILHSIQGWSNTNENYPDFVLEKERIDLHTLIRDFFSRLFGKKVLGDQTSH